MTNPNKNYPNFQKYIAEIVVSKRKERGWSQETLSVVCGHSRNCIQALEYRGHMPDVATLVAIFEAFNMNTEELMHIFLEAMREVSKDRSKQRELDGSSQIVDSLRIGGNEKACKIQSTDIEGQCEGIEEIYDQLRRLGLTDNYNGFLYSAHAVRLAAEQPDQLRLVTKSLHPAVAELHHTNWKTVERGIRYAIGIVWTIAPHIFQDMAGFPLSKKPTPTKFIAILSNYYLSHKNE